MDVVKFLEALARLEWGDGADYTAIELVKLMASAPLLEEESIAENVFEIYFEDRSRTWDRAQTHLKRKIVQL